MRTRFPRRMRTESGLTLIELMIAMVLGLVLVLGVINVFLAQRQSYRVNDGLAQMQDSGRIAFELMAREIREAGGTPCGTPLVANVLNGASSSIWLDWSSGGVEGFDGDEEIPGLQSGTGAGQRAAGTDAILVRSGSMNDAVIITEHKPSSAQFKANTVSHGVTDGDVVMACDYRQAAIFQVTNASSSSATIVHNTGAGSPGNCSKDLGFPTPDPCVAKTCSASGDCYSFEANGFLTRLSANAWFIGFNDRGGRSLYRMSRGGAAQEIVEGVRDMQISYLTRTGMNPDSDYVDASSIDSWAHDAPSVVIAARVVLDLESRESVGSDASTIKRQLLHVVSLRHREVVQ